MKILQENLETAKLHLDKLKKAQKEIIDYKILENFDPEDFNMVKTLDTFIFRFSKLQDHLGQKLFKNFLDAIGEYKENMSFLDILDKLEKLQIITSVKTWNDLRKLRNKLTHEYPNEIEEMKEEIKVAIEYIDTIEDVIIKIENYLKEKNVIVH